MYSVSDGRGNIIWEIYLATSINEKPIVDNAAVFLDFETVVHILLTNFSLLHIVGIFQYTISLET